MNKMNNYTASAVGGALMCFGAAFTSPAAAQSMDNYWKPDGLGNFIGEVEFPQSVGQTDTITGETTAADTGYFIKFATGQSALVTPRSRVIVTNLQGNVCVIGKEINPEEGISLARSLVNSCWTDGRPNHSYQLAIDNVAADINQTEQATGLVARAYIPMSDDAALAHSYNAQCKDNQKPLSWYTGITGNPQEDSLCLRVGIDKSETALAMLELGD